MSIRHAILGLLSEKPMHGYRLKEVFDHRLSPLWGLTTGQIYQSLAVLERAKLIAGRTDRGTQRRNRRVYAITDTGRRELDAWLRTPSASWVRPFREDLVLRLMMARASDAAEVWRTIEHRLAAAETLMQRIDRLRNGHCPPPDAIDVRGVFLEGMAHHLEADLRNLRRLRVELQRWAERVGADLSAPTDARAVTA